MTGIRIEQKLFEDVFRATLPKLAAHLDSCGLPLSIVTTNWFMCLYTNTLPAETLLRVWDLLIFEDPSVLVRVGVALLKLAEPELLAINDFIELSNKLQQLGRGMWSADKLLTVAYKQLGHTPGSRRALNALQQMQQTAYEVSLSLIDAVREVRMREGLLSADGMSGRTVDNAMAAANAAPTPRWGNLDELLASAENGNSAAAAEEEAVEEQAPSPEQAAADEVEAEEAGPAEEKAVVQIGLESGRPRPRSHRPSDMLARRGRERAVRGAAASHRACQSQLRGRPQVQARPCFGGRLALCALALRADGSHAVTIHYRLSSNDRRATMREAAVVVVVAEVKDRLRDDRSTSMARALKARWRSKRLRRRRGGIDGQAD